MRWQERIHERLKIRPPPLRKRIRNLPLIVDTLARELGPGWGQALVETGFEAFDFVFISVEIVAWSGDFTRVNLCRGRTRDDIQLEKCVRNLQHQNVWVVVLVADQDTLAGSAHAMSHVVLFQSL